MHPYSWSAQPKRIDDLNIFLSGQGLRPHYGEKSLPVLLIVKQKTFLAVFSKASSRSAVRTQPPSAQLEAASTNKSISFGQHRQKPCPVVTMQSL
jgi:hypothetical protein